MSTGGVRYYGRRQSDPGFLLAGISFVDDRERTTDDLWVESVPDETTRFSFTLARDQRG